MKIKVKFKHRRLPRVIMFEILIYLNRYKFIPLGIIARQIKGYPLRTLIFIVHQIPLAFFEIIKTGSRMNIPKAVAPETKEGISTNKLSRNKIIPSEKSSIQALHGPSCFFPSIHMTRSAN